MRNKIRDLSVPQRRQIRRTLLEKYGPYCQLCLAWGNSKSFAKIDVDVLDQAKSLSIDHIVPSSQGGTNSIDNFWPTHIACNEQRQSRPLTEKVKVDFSRRKVSKARKQMAQVRLAYSSTSQGF